MGPGTRAGPRDPAGWRHGEGFVRGDPAEGCGGSGGCPSRAGAGGVAGQERVGKGFQARRAAHASDLLPVTGKAGDCASQAGL